MSALTQRVTWPLRAVSGGISRAAHFIGRGLAYALWLLLAAPLFLFGASTAGARKSLLTVTKAIFGGASGIIEGVLRVPEGLVSTALMSVRNIANGRWRGSTVEAINLITQPIVGTVAAAIMPLFQAFQNVDDAVHPPRCLSDSELADYGRYFSEKELRGLRIHEGDGSWVFRLFGHSASAQTMANHIYLHWSVPMAEVGRHEIVHTLQYRESGGLAGFFGDYFGQALAFGAMGRDMYWDLRQERDAYRYEWVG